MSDWVRLTQDFKNILSREGYAPTPIAVGGGNVQLTLLRCMVRLDATKKRTRIASNFIAAAMHLGFLKRSDSRNLVDIPDNSDTALTFFQGYFLFEPFKTEVLIVEIVIEVISRAVPIATHAWRL